MLPGDLCILCRVVSAIVNGVRDGILDPLNQTAIHSETEDRGEITLGNAISRIDARRVSKLGNDVAMANDDSIGISVFGGHGSQLTSEHSQLVRKVFRPRASLCPGPLHRSLHGGFIHPNFVRLSAFPVVARREIVLRRRSLLCADDRCQNDDRSDHEEDEVPIRFHGFSTISLIQCVIFDTRPRTPCLNSCGRIRWDQSRKRTLPGDAFDQTLRIH
jgi:hypothetical protein